MADVAIASFHLVDVGPFRAPAGVVRIGLDRRELARTPGLVSARSLGGGDDFRLAMSFRPGRRAVFAVWEDDAACNRFLTSSPIAARWRRGTAWHVRLRLIAGHGTWAGERVLDDLERAVDDGGPVVTLTRATIAARSWPRFVRHSRAVTRSVDRVAGLRRVVGVGEVPLIRLGTVAVWDDGASVVRAVDGWTDHAAAMHDATSRRMFAESLFARFAPYASSGTWSGTDPVTTRE